MKGTMQRKTRLVEDRRLDIEGIRDIKNLDKREGK